MGWTFQPAKHYNNAHKIDRKAECDDLINNSGTLRVEKSAIVGAIYYAAVTRTGKHENGGIVALSPDEQHTFGAVIRTSVRSNDYYNFGYKEMDESMGPYQYDCPKSIIELLSPTNNQYALEWRNNCLQRTTDKATELRNLPIDTVIETPDGYRYIKRPAGHQFKKPYWFDTNRNVYIPKKYIKEYKIITESDAT